MPIYEFMCEDCKLKFERLQHYDADHPPCPEPDCEGIVVKLISAPSFVLKGGGWYRDGYSKKPSKT
jgi:putative FmdB family regulatory protein